MTSAKTTRLRFVLVGPRIAANVGNIARTAKSLGAELHLVGPLGFILSERKAKRAAVGYWEDLRPRIHVDSQSFWRDFERSSQTQFVFVEKDGVEIYCDFKYGPDCVLILGNEEEGVDPDFWKHESLPSISSCRIPMQSIRCLNLATSAGIVGYEVYRQWRMRKWTGEERPIMPSCPPEVLSFRA